MTREDAINILYGIQADNLNLDDAYTKDKYDALTMAIKALEQGDVLDKIRAEIERIQGNEYEVSDMQGNRYKYETIEKAEALQIIDKYRQKGGKE